MNMLTITRESEKVLIWMHRNKISGASIADKAGISRSAFNQQLQKNSFTNSVLNVIKSMGYK